MLGATLGVAATQGRDKLTVIASPGIASLGAWLEQLLAESTGKLGHGIVPVDAEPVGAPSAYGNDRLFAYLRLASDPEDAAVAALEAAGAPVGGVTPSRPCRPRPPFFPPAHAPPLSRPPLP